MKQHDKNAYLKPSRKELHIKTSSSTFHLDESAEPVYDSDYLSVWACDDRRILPAKWKKDSAQLTMETYKNELNEWLAVLKNQQPAATLVDLSDFGYIVPPDDQGRLAHFVFNRMNELNIRKNAFIQSESFLSQLSVQQTSKEGHTTVKVRFFAEPHEAYAWLLEE